MRHTRDEGDPTAFTGYDNQGITPDILADGFQLSAESTRPFSSDGNTVHTEIVTEDGSAIRFSRDQLEGVEPSEETGKFIVRLAKGAGEHKAAVISVTGAALLAGAATWVYRHNHNKKR